MSVFADFVPFFRTQYAGVLEDTCTVTRSAGQGTYNTSTRRFDAVPAPTSKYAGACQIRPDQRLDEREHAEAQQTVGRYLLIVPYTVDDIEPEDLVTCTASTYDTGLVGKTFRILGTNLDSFNAARVFEIELFEGRGNP